MATLLLLLASAAATFTGTITMSDSEVRATGVDYTFSLNFQQDVPADGKIVIRFPI